MPTLVLSERSVNLFGAILSKAYPCGPDSLVAIRVQLIELQEKLKKPQNQHTLQIFSWCRQGITETHSFLFFPLLIFRCRALECFNSFFEREKKPQNQNKKTKATQTPMFIFFLPVLFKLCFHHLQTQLV